MTDTTPVLRARPTRALAPAPAAEADAQLDVAMRRAQAVASAGDTIPRSYRGRPGAVLLADEWARARGLDLLTALQTVAFIDGKPVIDATMQRALAKRAGYVAKVVAASVTEATVEVWEGDEKLGTATYTIEEAKAAGLLGKNNWKQNPKSMLVARATTQAIRWHAPDVMTGVFTEEEIDEPLDVLAADVDVIDVAEVSTDVEHEDSGEGVGGDGSPAEEAAGAGVATSSPDAGDVDEQRARIRALKADMTPAQRTFLQEWMTSEEIVPAAATHAQLDAIEAHCHELLKEAT